jgi:hypothetical protein
MLVLNLSNNANVIFSDNAKGLHAVCHLWAKENSRLTQWTHLAHSDASIEDYKKAGFPVVLASLSIACGDWCTL